ncbi:MAG: hypothetical protein JXB42_11010 [Deltaproteobacteria bacterium]|nr:hypothetical protein [Deltaproteobacteria bacterium]
MRRSLSYRRCLSPAVFFFCISAASLFSDTGLYFSTQASLGYLSAKDGVLKDIAAAAATKIEISATEQNWGIKAFVIDRQAILRKDNWPLNDGTVTQYTFQNRLIGLAVHMSSFTGGPSFLIGIDSQGSPRASLEITRGTARFTAEAEHIQHQHQLSVAYADSERFNLLLKGQNVLLKASAELPFCLFSYQQTIYSRFETTSAMWDPDIDFNFYLINFSFGTRYQLDGFFQVAEINGTAYYNNSSYVFLGKNTGLTSSLFYKQKIRENLRVGTGVYYTAALIDDEFRVDSTPFHPSAGLYPVRVRNITWKDGLLWGALFGEYRYKNMEFACQWNQQFFTGSLSYDQRIWDSFPLVSHYETKYIDNEIGTSLVELTFKIRPADSCQFSVSQFIPLSLFGTTSPSSNSSAGNGGFVYGGLSILAECRF